MRLHTVYPKKYAHGFVVLCFVVVIQSFIMNSHEAFIHIYQGCFAGTGAIVRLPQCQWSKPDEYGEISQCITTTKHNKAVTVCIFLGIYCKSVDNLRAISKCIYHQQSFALFLKISSNMKFYQLMAFVLSAKVLSINFNHFIIIWLLLLYFAQFLYLRICWQGSSFLCQITSVHC